MPQENRINLKGVVVCLVIGILIGNQLNPFFTSSANDESTTSGISQDQVDMSLFWDVWSLVQSDYIDADIIDQDNEVYGATKGLVDSLEDPYSVFMDPEETEQFRTSLDGELEGIGAELTVRDGQLIIVSPIKGSPAEEKGILPGDYIYEVDGELTGDMTIWDAIMKIRGEPGTDVVLTIIRDGIEEPFDLTITRQTIYIPSIELTFDEDGGKKIAHLALYQFANDSYKEFQEAVREMLLENPDGMVLDLRLNGGGYLDVSVDILSEFFEDEEKAVIVKKRNQDNEIMYTSGGGQLKDIPLVVLIDEGSASASEIVAGALKDHKRAVIMGEQSFGKGSVQELTNLSGGASIRLTIAKWYTPNDISINETGITPDVVIEMETEAMDTENDVQLQAAEDYLTNL